MSSTLYFQDDSIQLVELSSEKSSTDNTIQSPLALAKLKRKNKIDSPTILSTNISVSSSSTSKISDIFLAKQQPEPARKQLKPIPAPRKLKPLQKSSSKENSASNSIDTQEHLNENVRKSSDTLDTISGDIQSIFSQRSETLSYKERLKNRFLTVKKQAESSIIHSDKSKVNKKQKLKEAVEKILAKEESQISEELNKYKQKFEGNNDSQNSYDFFCKVFDNNTEEIVTKQEEISAEDNAKQSVSDFLGIDNLETELTEYIFPHFVDYSANDKNIFKINRIRPRKRDEINYQTRNYEEEGIFKNKVNHISIYQLCLLEDRLYLDENRDWFSTDGTLKIQPDPRLKNSYKPFESELTQNEFINNYSPPTLYEPAEYTINTNENTLEIILGEIKFKHHHLFSKEHVLAQNLVHFYEEYKKLTSENALLIYLKKLDALRSAKNRLEEIITQSGDCSDNQLERYKKYSLEIKNISDKIYTIGLKERTLKKTILFLWKTIKNLRKTQKYSSTNIKLIITKESVDYNNEQQQWEQNLTAATNEMLEEAECNYETEINEYKIKYKQWKQQKQSNDDESEKSSEIISEKPKKPKRTFSKQQIESEVLEKMTLSLKPPGEPHLDFDLSFENQITDAPDNIKEKLRRADVFKTKIFAKILYNNREICKSKSMTLNNDFTCKFNEQFSIKLYKIPTSLSLQIYEQTTQITKRFLCEIHLYIPEFNCNINDTENTVELFENKDVFKYNHLATGTGVEMNKIIDLSELNINDFDSNSKLFTTGTVIYNAGWIVDKNYEQLIQTTPKENNMLIPTLFDIENLENWIKNYPDPLDPKNSLFFDYIKNLDPKTETEKNYFRLNPEITSLEFCSFDNLESNSRFKLLNLRFNNEPEFKNIVVPNRIKEIDEEIFSSYEKRRKEELVTQEIITDQFKDNNIDVQRKWAKKYLEQAENRIIQLSKIAEKKITLKDVLNEEVIPSFGSLTLSFLNWLQPKRPLRPTRKQITKNVSQINFKELNILVNIIGAIQVPNRKEFSQNESSTSSYKYDQNKDFSLVSVRPFATVNFREQCARTTVAEGSNPIWNQELNLILRGESVQSLHNIQDSVVINLYDETIDDLIIDDRIRDTNIHQHLGCNYLGSFEVPFKSLLENNRIEGTFKINLPTVLLGYERQNIKTFQENGEIINQKIDTFLTVFITLQPGVPSLQTDIKTELECTELEYIEEYITNWQTEYNNLYPQRKFSTFVTTLNGEKCCITRLFKEIKLPELNSDEITDVQLAKYVSLIPFRENNNLGLIPDIWLDPEQLLTLMMGSVKDHAVLLTCYCLTLGLNAWFLLGYSLIDGHTAYVLIRERNSLNFDYFIYNVKTGKRYNMYDNDCPLQKVFCVVNDENVWANVQDDDRIHQTRFDFTKSSDWLPLFNKEITAPTNLQQINVTYYEPPSVLLLQEKIEKKLRKKLMKWRKFSRTTFNHYCNAAFKKILAKLEYKNMQESSISESPEHFSEIHNLLSSYQIRGFVRSFPYTNVSDLVEFVQKTGVHLNDNPNIEFSLSVYAHSYNNNTVNIWLLIATLIRRR